ncbi:MAG: hypothetical protein HON55_00865 [Legionellales bacterium]|nr:hypothetical protein [Legionellales bacterium]
MPYSYRNNNTPPGSPLPQNNTIGGVKQVYVVAVGAVLFIAFVVLFFIFTSGASATKPLIIKKATPTISIASQSSTVNLRQKMPNIPVELSSIKLRTNSNEIDFDFALSTWTAYKILFSNEHKTIDIVFFNGNLPKEDPSDNIVKRPNVNYTPSGLKLFGDFAEKGIQVDSFVHNDDLNVTINFPKSMHLKKSHITKSHPSSLQLNFGHTNMADLVLIPEEIAVPRSKDNLVVDYHDNNNAIYETAKNLVEYGKNDEAMQQLQESPATIFENEKACALLAKLYLKKQSFIQAERVASQGVTIFTGSIELRKLWAQANFSLSNYKKALSILQDHSPDVAKNMDYYSLLASSALKLEKYEIASGVYRSLLAFKPSMSDWWAGLAITLQGQGKDNLALESYYRALQSGQLSSGLVGYVRTQISNLQ